MLYPDVPSCSGGFWGFLVLFCVVFVLFFMPGSYHGQILMYWGPCVARSLGFFSFQMIPPCSQGENPCCKPVSECGPGTHSIRGNLLETQVLRLSLPGLLHRKLRRRDPAAVVPQGPRETVMLKFQSPAPEGTASPKLQDDKNHWRGETVIPRHPPPAGLARRLEWGPETHLFSTGASLAGSNSLRPPKALELNPNPAPRAAS